MDDLFEKLQGLLEGEFYYGNSIKAMATRKVYATDASVYQELPIAVCLPKTTEDLRHLISFANLHQVGLIPRAAGTSLAGQVVGNGIVVDISTHFSAILEINKEEKWVRVQPGVIRDDLNNFLRPFGLMFGPETSTANRAMIGGMIGNNSCGLHSIVWGDTRSNLLEVKALLADGNEVLFADLSKDEFDRKRNQDDLEGAIYKGLHSVLNDNENQQSIKTAFPKPSVKRRNTGYALDNLLQMVETNAPFNLSSLVAGSEGTLCFVTEAKLKLLCLPLEQVGLVAVHTRSVQEALQINLIALEHACTASELVDDLILSYTLGNIEQSKNRFFIEGDPKAILMVEFMNDSVANLMCQKQNFIDSLKGKKLGYAYPFLLGNEANRAWDLRKAGLGLLRNEPGDVQPVNLIEDCAVDVNDLANYVRDVDKLLRDHGLRYSIYAHAGAGELHVEPMINLKTEQGRELFRVILSETSLLIRSYRGSLSGEHGDGRLRGEFISTVMGAQNYNLFKQIKEIFDPQSIFNKGKIVDTPPMDKYTRYEENSDQDQHNTYFDFSSQESILRLAEKCSGSGDCKKSHFSGGVMCPSFMVSRNERDSTRARANMLRQFYSAKISRNKEAYEQVKDILDLCLSCKGCKSECPSAVDVGKMKAEFTQEYYDSFGTPFRSKIIGNFSHLMQWASYCPSLYNAVVRTKTLRRMVNKIVGFHPDRSMPPLGSTTLRRWFRRHGASLNEKHQKKGSVYFFCDEFTNYNDVSVGQAAIRLLTLLGYKVVIPDHIESGRAFLSKGLVKKAKEIAIKNVLLLKDIVQENSPLIGVEPSTILAFRDEYPELVPKSLLADASRIAKNTFLFEEWLAGEIEKGNVSSKQFSLKSRKIWLHVHCHQKALSSSMSIIRCLSLPANYQVSEIPSGCCGMAGAFGYEKEHFRMSMDVAELVLLPKVRSTQGDIIAASGTSCRHQIKDGAGEVAKHTAEILYDALNSQLKPVD